MRSFAVLIDSDPGSYITFNVNLDTTVDSPTDAELNDIADKLLNSDYCERVLGNQFTSITGISVVEDRSVPVA